MFSHARTLLLFLVGTWFIGATVAPATGQQQTGGPGDGNAKIRCVVENNIGTRKEISVPVQLIMPATETPLRATCGGNAAIPLAMLKDHWLPVTQGIDGKVVATLDPLYIDRTGKPTEVTVSFRPLKFGSAAEIKEWNSARLSIIEKSYSERLTGLRNNETPCKFSPWCKDAEENLDAKKVDALREIERIRVLANKGLTTVESQSSGQFTQPPGLIQCTIQKRRGKRINAGLPARIPVHWRSMPVSVACGTPEKPGVSQSIRMPRDRWLPFTVILDDMVIAHIDPKPRYRFRKPAQMILTLYPKVFENAADRERWFKARAAMIEKADEARQKYILAQGVDCYSRISCSDVLEEQEEQKKSWLADLARLRAATSILPPGTVYKKPPSVEIEDGGTKLCLVKSGDGTWKSRSCEKPAVKIRRIVVDGKEQCIAQVDATTWESHPCPRYR